MEKIKINNFNLWISKTFKGRTKKITSNKGNKKNQFVKNIIFSRRVKYLILFYIFIQGLSLNYKGRMMLDKFSYITLKINSTGNISIFHKKTSPNYLYGNIQAPEPDDIYINGVQQNEIKSMYNFNKRENIIKLVWKHEIKTTCYLFSACDQITEINLSNFNSSNVENMALMFFRCFSLTSLDLSNFNTSKVTDMYQMFYCCYSLTSLNLSNFNTHLVKNMGSMFGGCSSLKSLDLSSFDTSKVIFMDNMFSYCRSLMSLNLSSFDTSKVIFMNNMFESCSSITSLDISNFDTSNATNIDSMFFYCSSLIYLNLKNSMIKGAARFDSIFTRIPSNITLCSIDYTWSIKLNGYYAYIDFNKSQINYKEYKCYKKYQYTFEQYKSYICEKNDKNYYQIYRLGKDFLSYLYCDTENINMTFFVENSISDLTNEFEKSIIDNGNEMQVTQKNILLMMTNTKNQKKNEVKNITTIDLGECEKKLKSFYHISNKSSLYILKMDVKEEGMNIPLTEYNIYYPFDNKNLVQLNLSICKDIKIDISNAIGINDDIEKYNLSSDYYNSICSKATSKSGTDIPLSDRKKEFINNNMTLCEEDCTLIDYNYTSKKAKCSCLTKITLPSIGEIKFDKNKLYESFTNIKSVTNLNLMKCFNKAFEGKSISKNSSFYIYLIFLIFFGAIVFLFYYKYFSIFIKVIQNILNAKKYFSKSTGPNINMVINNNPEQRILKKRKRRKNYILKDNNPKLETEPDKNNNEILPPKKRKKKKKKRNTVNTMMMSSKIETFTSQELIEPRNNNDIMNPPTTKNNDDVINKDIKDKYKEILEYIDYEINKLSYEEAIIKDQRTFIQYYLSLLRSGHILIFSFYFKNNDYNSKIIKIFLFFFLMTVHFTVNALFFNDKTMHKIYLDNGSYNFIYQIPQIIYSSVISSVISVLVKYLSLSQKVIVKFKQEKNYALFDSKFQKLLLILKIRFILFFIVTFTFVNFRLL